VWKHKLCMGTGPSLQLPLPEQIRLIAKVGFDGFFVNWSQGMDLQALRALGDTLGLYFQSVHAPFGRVQNLWQETELTREVLEEQLTCLRETAAAGVDLVVCHVFIGFKDHTPTQFGIDNYRVMVEEARRLGIRIAFENTEGEEYLHAVMEAFAEEAHVGFCWDTGHEMCYNHSQDLLERYGSRLFGTHLNDNLGIKDYEGQITFHDDLHLLPFDGIANWQNVAARLDREGFEGPLTFELKYTTTLNGCDHRVYGHMSVEAYVTQAYIRACRVAALRNR